MRGTPEERFWAKVDKSGGPDACWPWTGCRNRQGYGATTLGGKRTGAHRVALALVTGPIPEGRFACHKCDNPPCCNPAHLYAGTPLDNARDSSRRGRRLRNIEIPECGRWATEGAKALRAFLVANDVLVQWFALAVGANPDLGRRWVGGSVRPDACRRDAIEKWTSGEVPARLWRKPDEQIALNRVKPFARKRAARAA